MFCRILLVPHNIVLDLNNVMQKFANEPFIIHWVGGGEVIDVGFLNENHHKN